MQSRDVGIVYLVLLGAANLSVMARANRTGIREPLLNDLAELAESIDTLADKNSGDETAFEKILCRISDHLIKGGVPIPIADLARIINRVRGGPITVEELLGLMLPSA